MYPINVQSEGVLREIKTTCKISAKGRNDFAKYYALWDTGANMTAISNKVVQDLGLVPYMYRINTTAGGNVRSNLYYVDLILPNEVLFPRLQVTNCYMDDFDILIGMDVITQGDLAITNKDGSTLFSFDIPSTRRIDFNLQ